MLERLARQLGESLQEDETLSAYVLIDPMLREPFPAEWLEAESRQTWPVPVHHPLLKDKQLPRLIHLHPHDTRLLEASLAQAADEQADPDSERTQGFALGGWLLTAAPVDALVRHLARVMQGGFWGQRSSQLIRWADRRVMQWMWPVLTPVQQASLLGPVQRWYSLDRCTQLVLFQSDASPDPASARFSTAQWNHALKSETVHDLLRGWQRFAGVLPVDHLQQASRAADAVIAAGVVNRQDRVLLGAYVLQIHPELTTHPTVRTAIARAIGGDASLAEALDDIPDPQGWDAIRAELDPAFARASIQQIAQGEHLG
ncbi:MAG: DUF4123 domain-containing protein [Pseudomonadota bacterium]